MIRGLFILILAHSLLAADGLYTISAPCAPGRCAASVLNDRGDIAGQVFYSGSGPDGRGFEVIAGHLIQPLNPLGGKADYVLPNWINNSGVLALEFGAYRQPSAAGLYLPASGSLVNLNSIRLWTGPARALTVNDSGAVAAITTNPNDPFSIDPRGQATNYFAILNNQISIYSANLNDSSGPGFSFTGMSWMVSSPATGAVEVRKQIIAFSSGGHILERDYGQSGIIRYYINVPGVGEKQLSGLKEPPFAVNDRDELLLRGVVDDYVWDQASSPRRLQDLIDPSSTWTILRGIAINNAGQILVEARQNTFTTSLLLSPPS